MKLSADRLTAARILLRVEEGAFASRVIKGDTPSAARVRVLETLRWMRALDAVLKPLSRRPLAKLDPEVLVALRLGLVEIVKLGTEPALATDGAVRLAKRLGRSSASGMVNAVLRKAAHSWPKVLERAEIDVRHSHPWWVFNRWRRSFGETAAAAAMASAQRRAAGFRTAASNSGRTPGAPERGWPRTTCEHWFARWRMAPPTRRTPARSW